MGLPKTLPALPIPAISEDTVTFKLTKETLLMALRELGFNLPDDTDVTCERGLGKDCFELTDHGHIEVSYTVIEQTTPLRIMSLEEANRTLDGEDGYIFDIRDNPPKLFLHEDSL